jgi:hypothetical protein
VKGIVHAYPNRKGECMHLESINCVGNNEPESRCYDLSMDHDGARMSQTCSSLRVAATFPTHILKVDWVDLLW